MEIERQKKENTGKIKAAYVLQNEFKYDRWETREVKDENGF